jgi:hypothetical protein
VAATESPARRSTLMADLHAAQDHHQRDMLKVDELAHNLHAVYRLTERCRAIVATAKSHPSDGKLNLVLVGDQTDLEAAIFTWKTSRKQHHAIAQRLGWAA